MSLLGGLINILNLIYCYKLDPRAPIKAINLKILQTEVYNTSGDYPRLNTQSEESVSERLKGRGQVTCRKFQHFIGLFYNKRLDWIHFILVFLLYMYAYQESQGHLRVTQHLKSYKVARLLCQLFVHTPLLSCNRTHGV